MANRNNYPIHAMNCALWSSDDHSGAFSRPVFSQLSDDHHLCSRTILHVKRANLNTNKSGYHKQQGVARKAARWPEFGRKTSRNPREKAPPCVRGASLRARHLKASRAGVRVPPQRRRRLPRRQQLDSECRRGRWRRGPSSSRHETNVSCLCWVLAI